jgi:proton-dependent oligopeptide transporter, POT family
MMTGAYYLHLFAANLLAGWPGSFMERMPGSHFWLLHSAVVFGAALTLLLLRGTVSRLLVPAFAASAEHRHP